MSYFRRYYYPLLEGGTNLVGSTLVSTIIIIGGTNLVGSTLVSTIIIIIHFLEGPKKFLVRPKNN